MPAGISDVEVTVAARVVKIIAQQAFGDIKNARVIKKGAEPLILVEERHQCRSRRALMGFPGVTTAVQRPYILKSLSDGGNIVGKEPWKRQEAEGLKEGMLLL